MCTAVLLTFADLRATARAGSSQNPAKCIFRHLELCSSSSSWRAEPCAWNLRRALSAAESRPSQPGSSEDAGFGTDLISCCWLIEADQIRLTAGIRIALSDEYRANVGSYRDSSDSSQPFSEAVRGAIVARRSNRHLTA